MNSTETLSARIQMPCPKPIPKEGDIYTETFLGRGKYPKVLSTIPEL